MTTYYRNRGFVFCIHPKEEGWTLNRLPEDLPQNFNSVTFEKIILELHAPDDDDHGQLIRIRNSAMNLVSTLAASAGLSEMTITCSETESKTPWDSPLYGDLSRCDENPIELLLGTFRYLRKIHHVIVDYPLSTENDVDIQEQIEKVLYCMTSSVAFGSEKTPVAFGVEENDDCIQRNEKAKTILLDRDLDSLSNKTAADLRLERFWRGPSYFKEMKQLIDGESDLCDQDKREVSLAWEIRWAEYMSCLAQFTEWEARLSPEDDYPADRWRVQCPEGYPPFGIF